MGLLDLPLELFDQIMEEVLTDMGMDAAWKLRPACMTFSKWIERKIFAYRPLQDFQSWIKRPHIGHQPAGRLLLYRTQKLLDAHSDLPSALNRSVDYLHGLGIFGTPNEEDLLQQLCVAVAEKPWRDLWDELRMGFRRTSLQTTAERDLADGLAAAALINNIPLFSACLNRGALPWLSSVAFGCSLSIAARSPGRAGLLRFILQNLQGQIGINDSYLQAVYPMFDNGIREALQNRNYQGFNSLVQWFYGHVALSKKVHNSWLGYAIRSDHVPSIEAIISLGRRWPKVTPTNFKDAIVRGNLGTVVTLIEKGEARIEGFWNTTPLAQAVRYGHEDIAQELLNRGVDPNGSAYARACSPLNYAVRRGNLNLVNMLLDKGATVNGYHPEQKEAMLQFSLDKHLIYIHTRLVEAEEEENHTRLMEAEEEENHPRIAKRKAAEDHSGDGSRSSTRKKQKLIDDGSGNDLEEDSSSGLSSYDDDDDEEEDDDDEEEEEEEEDDEDHSDENDSDEDESRE